MRHIAIRSSDAPGGEMMAAAIARVLARVSEAHTENETLKVLAIFSLTGLLLSVISALYGLDTSWAFF
jgi:Mg2+ and Co2+ transporter CorA